MRSGKQLAAVVVALVTLLGSAVAVAAHYRAASSTVELAVTDGNVELTMESLWAKGSASGFSPSLYGPDDRGALVASVTPWDSDTTDTSHPAYDRRIQSTEIDMTGRADGHWVVSAASSARVGGILNTASSSFSAEASFTKAGDTFDLPPRFQSTIITTIGIGYDYSQNLNAVDPEGGNVTYTLLEDVNAPAYGAVVVSDGLGTPIPGFTLSATGQVTIPAATTAGFADGNMFVFKVRVSDENGNYVDRDVLLTATATDNTPPAFDQVPEGVVTVAPGGTLELDVSASDDDGAQTLSFSASGVPAWGSFTSTPGNPATGTFTFTPTAAQAGTTVGINIEVSDDHDTVPFTVSKFFQIQVTEDDGGDPPPPPAPAPAPVGCPDIVSAAPFGDTGETTVEQQDAIDCIAAYGITVGTANTAYSPHDPISRWQVALMAYRIHTKALQYDVPSGAAHPFTDVTHIPDMDAALSAMWDLGYLKGTGDGTLHPDRSISRVELALILYRIGQQAGLELDTSADHGFTDTDGLSDEAAEAVSAMSGAGIFPFGGTELLPDSALTRAEAAVMIARFLDYAETALPGTS